LRNIHTRGIEDSTQTKKREPMNDPELDEMTGTDGEGLSTNFYDDYDDEPESAPVASPVSNIGRGRPTPHGGTPRGMQSSPLFQQADMFPRANQLEVYKMEDGRPYSLGNIGLNATQPEFIRKYAKSCPGQFILRPVDSLGAALGEEFTLNIHETHPSLQAAASPVDAAMAQGPESSHLAFDLLRGELEAARRQHELLRTQLEDERRILAEERSEVAAERVAMASQAANAVSNQHQRQMAYANEQSNQMITTLTSVFQAAQAQQQQSMALQSQAHEQLMERQRAQDAEDRQRRDESAEREREKARREAKEKRVESEMSLQRERDYHLRLREIEKQGSGLGAMKKILNDFGMTPKDVLDKVMDNGGGSDPGMGSAIVGAVADVAKSFAANAAEASKAQAAVQQRQIEVSALLQAQQNQPDYLEDEDDDMPDIDAPPFEIEADEPHQGTSPEILAHFRSENPPKNAGPDQNAQVSALPLQTQKKARISARKLVKQMSGTEPGEWTAIIAGELAVCRELLDYIYVASIRSTLLEAGAGQDFANQIIQHIDDSGIVPADIPRG
jgi:hypothetical protein